MSESPWILTTDVLPKNAAPVLGYWEALARHNFETVRRAGKKWFSCACGDEMNDPPDAWMHIPEPPENPSEAA